MLTFLPMVWHGAKPTVKRNERETKQTESVLYMMENGKGEKKFNCSRAELFIKAPNIFLFIYLNELENFYLEGRTRQFNLHEVLVH